MIPRRTSMMKPIWGYMNKAVITRPMTISGTGLSNKRWDEVRHDRSTLAQTYDFPNLRVMLAIFHRCVHLVSSSKSINCSKNKVSFRQNYEQESLNKVWLSKDDTRSLPIYHTRLTETSQMLNFRAPTKAQMAVKRKMAERIAWYERPSFKTSNTWSSSIFEVA